MALQFKVDELDRLTIDHIKNQFLGMDLPFEAFYLKSGRQAEEWSDDVNGLRIKLNNKIIFQIHKTSAMLSVKHVPDSHKESIVKVVQRLNLAKQPDFTLGITLSALFLLLACAVIALKALPMAENFAAVMVAALVASMIGLTILGTTQQKSTDNDASFVLGLILYALGVMAFAPSSLLTMPLVKALLYKRGYQYLSGVESADPQLSTTEK
ncbi:hypothetical protein [Vibrio viridaestus]|uniref:Uncharacterized protein n=1 Tax=Vibrio viridaestus TaxID=2487322 RepID=A0A3N9TEU7_9VIBR|nr:hypothetical protein [Vibrio viridaestus]RQW62243.1 hypothetical protein EES38_16140 [Vibrio viridaestus]